MQELNRLIRSTSAAIQGIIAVLRVEKNMQIHGLMGVFITLLSYFAHIPWLQYLILLFLIIWIWSLELINTSIERCLDLISTNHNPKIKLAKDAAAGAVLISSIFAVMVGFTILYNPLVNQTVMLQTRIQDITLTAIQLAVLVCIWLASLAIIIKWSSLVKKRYMITLILTTILFFLFLISNHSWFQLFSLLSPIGILIFIRRNHLVYYFYKLFVAGIGAIVLYHLLK